MSLFNSTGKHGGDAFWNGSRWIRHDYASTNQAIEAGRVYNNEHNSWRHVQNGIEGFAQRYAAHLGGEVINQNGTLYVGYTQNNSIVQVDQNYNAITGDIAGGVSVIDLLEIGEIDSGQDIDPADITQAAENALDYVNAFYEKEEAACNIGVQCAFEELTGRPEFGGMRANDIVEYLSQSDNGDWSGIAMSNVQQVVNNGGIVIAGTTNPSGSGHVVLIVPGNEFASGANYWNGLVPVAMDTGPGKKWVSRGISSSWGKSSKEDVKFFRFTGGN